MLLTLSLFLFQATPSDQAPPPPAVARDLQLNEVGDLIDPRAAYRNALAAQLLGNVVDYTLADAAASDERDPSDQMGLMLLQLALKSGGQEETQAQLPTALLKDAWLAPTRRYPFSSSEDLLDTIKTYMEPSFSDGESSLKVEANEDGIMLLSYLTHEQGAWLHRFFRYQREDQDWQGQVEVTVLQASTSAQAIPASMTTAAMLSSVSELEDARKALEAADFSLIAQPRLLIMPWQDGDLSILSETSYVKAWTLKTVEPGGQEIADPEIDTLQEGLRFSCRLRQVGEEAYGIHFSVDVSDLERPIPTEVVEFKGGKGRTGAQVSHPVMHNLHSELDVRLRSGAGFRLPIASEDGGKAAVLLIHFKRLAPPEDQ